MVGKARLEEPEQEHRHFFDPLASTRLFVPCPLCWTWQSYGAEAQLAKKVHGGGRRHDTAAELQNSALPTLSALQDWLLHLPGEPRLLFYSQSTWGSSAHRSPHHLYRNLLFFFNFFFFYRGLCRCLLPWKHVLKSAFSLHFVLRASVATTATPDSPLLPAGCPTMGCSGALRSGPDEVPVFP